MTEAYRCNYCLGADYQTASTGIRDWEYGVDGTYSYLRCTNCGGVQLEPFPDLAALKRAYDIDYHGYASGKERGAAFGLLYRAREALFRKTMKRWVNPASKVLDVGCGQGDFLRSLKAMGVSRLEGIDFSQAMIDTLTREDISGFCGTFSDFQGVDGSYDLISMNNYLEHTLDPAAELKKARELLAPEGLLIGEVPGFDSWERRLFNRYWGGNHVPRHTYQFGPGFLAQLLSRCGFSQIDINHQLNTSHWALSVQNFMQRKRSDLRNNPGLRHGRTSYYVPLLLAFIPVNVICVMFRRSGCIRFSARKSGD